MSPLSREATDSQSLQMALNVAQKETGRAKKDYGTGRKKQETAKKEHGTTSAIWSTLEWARGLRLATGYRRVLRTQCFPPNHDRCEPFPIPTTSVLYINKDRPEAKYANAIIHSRLPYAERDSNSFQLGEISTSPILSPMVRYRSITAHPFGIPIPGITYCVQSHAPKPLSTSFFSVYRCLRRCRPLPYLQRNEAWQKLAIYGASKHGNMHTLWDTMRWMNVTDCRIGMQNRAHIR